MVNLLSSELTCDVYSHAAQDGPKKQRGRFFSLLILLLVTFIFSEITASTVQ
jgi:hypothetical protein